jgi:hypothetical protein
MHKKTRRQTRLNSNMLDLHTAWVALLNRWDWPIALNLNFKAGIRKDDAVSAAVRYWNCIERQVYGRRKAEAGLKLGRFCVLDGSAETSNWHYHCAVKVPPVKFWDETTEEFCSLLLEQWKCIRSAGRFATCSPTECQLAWLKYICKKEIIRAGEICERTTVWPHQKFPS